MTAASTPNGPARILIADDDRLVRYTVSRGLREAGYEVLEAENGEQAVAICREEKPDLAILDIRMPGLDGLEAAQRLHEELNVPFLMFTAYGEKEEVQTASEHGALGYLVKPLDVTQLLPAVETALRRAEERRQLRETGEHLQRALDANRVTSVAVGLVMERFRLDRRQAFETLRRKARSQRRKLSDVAEEVVAAADILSLEQL